ncbi:MAG: hypothetical protein ACOX7F_00290 [Eubacteriales bacterium]
MLQLFLSTALIDLPFAIPMGLLCFAVGRWGLRRCPAAPGLVRGCFFLCFAALTAGMLYGMLRFHGVLLFPADNDFSYHWFGASWRDEGFQVLYGCGTALLGLAAAFLSERKRANSMQ